MSKKETEFIALKYFPKMDSFLENLQHKSIHLVGVTGAEGSSILRFLRKHGIEKITLHDFLAEGSIEKSFRLWHKGITSRLREKLYLEFVKDIEGLPFYSGKDYLRGILSADLIFVPQSWRLYQKINFPLFKAKEKNIPFYSLTRLYLDFAPSIIIGVTGTVGKGSTANLIFNILEKNLFPHRKIYFAGNETWRLQIADKIDEMHPSDILVLEISHRQLLDNFTRAPHIVVFTNLYPNHLDELSWEEYKKIKLSLLRKQQVNDFSLINYDNLELRRISNSLHSQIIYFSSKNKKMNIKDVQKIYADFMDKKNVHYLENILAASTVACIFGIPELRIKKAIQETEGLPARLEYLGEKNGIQFYDDIKSTTPWATIAALEKLGNDIILICGGRGKKIDYQELIKVLKKRVKYTLILKSDIAFLFQKLLKGKSYRIVSNLREAIDKALKLAKKGDKILISPAGSFFYTDFVKGKKSLKKIFEEAILPRRID